MFKKRLGIVSSKNFSANQKKIKKIKQIYEKLLSFKYLIKTRCRKRKKELLLSNEQNTLFNLFKSNYEKDEGLITDEKINDAFNRIKSSSDIIHNKLVKMINAN
jgi:hypothetical protein